MAAELHISLTDETPETKTGQDLQPPLLSDEERARLSSQPRTVDALTQTSTTALATLDHQQLQLDELKTIAEFTRESFDALNALLETMQASQQGTPAQTPVMPGLPLPTPGGASTAEGGVAGAGAILSGAATLLADRITSAMGDTALKWGPKLAAASQSTSITTGEVARGAFADEMMKLGEQVPILGGLVKMLRAGLESLTAATNQAAKEIVHAGNLAASRLTGDPNAIQFANLQKRIEELEREGSTINRMSAATLRKRDLAPLQARMKVESELSQQAGRLSQYSPELAAAQAYSEQRRVQEDIRLGNSAFGSHLADIQRLRADLEAATRRLNEQKNLEETFRRKDELRIDLAIRELASEMKDANGRLELLKAITEKEAGRSEEMDKVKVRYSREIRDRIEKIKDRQSVDTMQDVLDKLRNQVAGEPLGPKYGEKDDPRLDVPVFDPDFLFAF